jgi:hypothetical protein
MALMTRPRRPITRPISSLATDSSSVTRAAAFNFVNFNGVGIINQPFNDIFE